MPALAASRLHVLASLALVAPAMAGAQSALGPAAPRAAAEVCAADAARWDAAGGLVAVWVQRRPAALGDGRTFAAELDHAVARGLAAWADGVPGARLVRVADSASADVRVVWRRTLAAPAAGRTTREVAPDGRIASALVELATRDVRGASLRTSEVAAVAQHEFAHVLGLAAGDDGDDGAVAHLAADRPSRRDRAELRARYGAARDCGRVAAGPDRP